MMWYMCRYKMLEDTLWPTNDLSTEQATKKLISTYNLSDVVVYGKTQIFFKLQKTIFFLEAERQKRLPHLVNTKLTGDCSIALLMCC